MSQIASVITFADTGSNATVNGTRLNSHVNDSALLNGAVLDQTEKTLPGSADTLLLGDSTVASSGYPKKVQIGNLLLESQRNGTQQYVASDTGSASAYAVALSPAATAYTAGMVVRFKAGAASTGASTINVNSLGVKTIKNRAGADLAANDILTGQLITLVYDGSYFQLAECLSASQVLTANIAEAARNGTVQYAGTSSGTDTIVGPLAPLPTVLSAGLIVRFKAGGTNTTAATFNCGYGGGVAIKKIVNGAVVALKAKDIQTGDIVTLVYDGTQWILSGHVRSWDFVSAAPDALPGSGAKVDIAHGLGAVPTKWSVVLVQTGASADNGYATNDEVDIFGFQNTGNQANAFVVSRDATNVTISQTNNVNITIIPKAGGAHADVTAEASWKIKVYASL